MNTLANNPLIAEYPYFIQPIIDELRECNDPQQRTQLKSRLAVNVGSPLALREILGLNSESMSDFYGENDTPSPTTEAAIETFLNTFGNKQSPVHEMPPIGTFLPPDATAAIAELQPVDEIPNDNTSSIIDAFLEAVPPKIPGIRNPIPQHAPTENLNKRQEIAPGNNPETESIPQTQEELGTPENISLTEGLVRIMIKNGNFCKALDIITQLNLKNSEKSIYFADQIRFLRKLIANKEKK